MCSARCVQVILVDIKFLSQFLLELILASIERRKSRVFPEGYAAFTRESKRRIR